MFETRQRQGIFAGIVSGIVGWVMVIYFSFDPVLSFLIIAIVSYVVSRVVIYRGNKQKK